MSTSDLIDRLDVMTTHFRADDGGYAEVDHIELTKEDFAVATEEAKALNTTHGLPFNNGEPIMFRGIPIVGDCKETRVVIRP